ncbi:MAG: cell division protein ZipA [Gammaproteobacteria bacterium]
MNTLRWVLLVIGGIFLFAIYWFGRDSRPKQTSELFDADFNEDDLPVLTVPPDESFDPYVATERLHEAEIEELQTLLDEQAADRPTVRRGPGADSGERDPQKVIAIYLAARPPSMLRQGDLLRAFGELDLQYGEMQIYHRLVEDGHHQRILFSVANLIKPGTLDITDQADFACPGLSMFMQLPGPLNDMLAFDQMLECAQSLAQRLGARLLDETRSAFTEQTIDHIRDEINNYRLRSYRAPGPAKHA